MCLVAVDYTILKNNYHNALCITAEESQSRLCKLLNLISFANISTQRVNVVSVERRKFTPAHPANGTPMRPPTRPKMDGFEACSLNNIPSLADPANLTLPGEGLQITVYYQFQSTRAVAVFAYSPMGDSECAFVKNFLAAAWKRERKSTRCCVHVADARLQFDLDEVIKFYFNQA